VEAEALKEAGSGSKKYSTVSTPLVLSLFGEGGPNLHPLVFLIARIRQEFSSKLLDFLVYLQN